MAKRATPCVSSWLLAIALLAVACRGEREQRDPREPAATSAAPAALVGEPEPFAGAIAKHLASVPDPALVPEAGASPAEIMARLDNAGFRDRVVGFVRAVAAGGPSVTCTVPLTTAQPLQAIVWLFLDGAAVGRGQSASADLCVTLKDATRRALASAGPARERLAQARFVVEIPERDYAVVEHEGKGVELASGVVPVRALDKALLRRRIDEGKAYLLRVMDAKLGGVHKYYHAPGDGFEPRLHTIYTASTIFTLLALHAHAPDERLREPIERAARFLLSMQSLAPGQRSHGAFHYSLDLERQEPEPKFVVGTTSKTIFTLIDLHAFTKDRKYLEVARLAADWLLTMQQPDGRVRSYLRRKPSGSWLVSRKESLLYTGQVLSALSRLHLATRDAKYLGAAGLTARYLSAKVASQGCYLGDDYRKPNPISSSWVILSLFDYARASGDAQMRAMAFRCADELLARQIRDPDDVYRDGRWRASLSSSGNGWLAEVLAVLYRDCLANDPGDCARYRDAVVRVIRLLMQYTYAPESAFLVANPAMATGGVFWNTRDRYVRTDSVCHAMNAYVYMLDHLDEGVLIELPEPPLAERLGGSGAPPRRAGSLDEADERDGEAAPSRAPAADDDEAADETADEAAE